MRWKIVTPLVLAVFINSCVSSSQNIIATQIKPFSTERLDYWDNRTKTTPYSFATDIPRETKTQVTVTNTITKTQEVISDTLTPTVDWVWELELPFQLGNHNLLAYSGNNLLGSQHDIYITDITGENNIKIIDSQSMDVQPTWSPNGMSICFISWDFDNEVNYIRIIDLRTGVISTIYSSMAWITSPAWSPDGKRILFLKNDEYGWESTNNLLVIDINGENLENITNNSTGDYLDPSWSPDGKQIIYSEKLEGSLKYYIYQLNLETKRNQRISNVGANYRSPIYSSNGDWIAFTEERNNERSIYIMRSNGKDIRRLLPKNIQGSSPSWSSNGRYIAFQATESPACNGGLCRYIIYIINSDGTGLRQIEVIGGDEYDPEWQK